MNDTGVSNAFQQQESTANARFTSTTFASGAPSTAPVMTGGQVVTTMWGNITLVTPVNFYEVAVQPPAGASSYLYDATVGHEDLYSFPALSAVAPTLYAVAVKGILAKSDAGAKTASLRLKSSASDSAGSVSSIAPGTSFAWASSLFERDPNGGGAWTLAALNAAQAGVKVET
jgi:hypothetical protein